ncbi:hypothetical protein ACOACO_14945 [Nocardioides sp. CPCC 205120]|uniref:hypothetical protein n=1 Tax=Nocardioides sp. CPCC 205120 TaxID=3406462 RepID=UPI003B504CD8
MLTTESPRTPSSGVAAIGAVAALVLGFAALTALAVGILAGPGEGYGVLAGAVLAVAVLASGTASVAVVAAILPSLSLVVALLTYGLQLVVLLVVLLAVERSEVGPEVLSQRWLGGAVIVTTLVWSAVQVVVTTRRRVPLDLAPARPPVSHDDQAGARAA